LPDTGRLTDLHAGVLIARTATARDATHIDGSARQLDGLLAVSVRASIWRRRGPARDQDGLLIGREAMKN
jgi:hypothetical protein